MRFNARIRNVGVFAKFCASLASLEELAWCRLSDEDVRFTVLPEKGSQVWSVLKIETVFETYNLASASQNNIINLEVPIQALQNALKSAEKATTVSLRLTKKNSTPLLVLTIVTASFSAHQVVDNAFAAGSGSYSFEIPEPTPSGDHERETVITQDIPVRVLAAQKVAGLLEPSTPEPDVYIYLPSLAQVKSVSERFTKLAATTKAVATAGASTRLNLSANMHGSFRIGLKNDALSVSSVWTGLVNPELEPSTISQDINDHPSSRMRLLGGEHGEREEGWARVCIDAKDWNKVLSVGRLGVRVIACFLNEIGLVLYVYHQGQDSNADETCLTYFINSFNT